MEKTLKWIMKYCDKMIGRALRLEDRRDSEDLDGARWHGQTEAYEDVKEYIRALLEDDEDVDGKSLEEIMKEAETGKDRRRVHIGFCALCGAGLKKFDFDADEKGEVFRVEGKCPKCGAIVNAKRGGDDDEKTDKAGA